MCLSFQLMVLFLLLVSSMSPIVHIVKAGSSETESLANVTEIHDGLDFSSNNDGGYSFGIFSVKFSTDGRELVAGTSRDSIYVYDLDANKLSLRILAHTSDVNTVCFADETSHLIYSGSDDSFCKMVSIQQNDNDNFKKHASNGPPGSPEDRRRQQLFNSTWKIE